MASACIEVKHYGSYLVEAYLRLVVAVGSYVSLCVVVAEEHVVNGEGCAVARAGEHRAAPAQDVQNSGIALQGVRRKAGDGHPAAQKPFIILASVGCTDISI